MAGGDERLSHGPSHARPARRLRVPPRQRDVDAVAAQRTGSWIRWIAAGLVVASLLPNPSRPGAASRPTSAFFQRDLISRLGPDPLILVEGADLGDSMLWQATSGFTFRMPNAYLGLTPPGAIRPRLANALLSGHPPRVPAAGFMRYLHSTDVQAIVVAGSPWEPWRRYLAPIGLIPQRIDGVDLYVVPGSVSLRAR